MPALSTRSHTHTCSHTLRKRGYFTVSFVIKSMKIAHLDNPSLSALSARETLTHPMQSFPHYHTPIISRGPTSKSQKNELKGTATCFSFRGGRSKSRSSSLSRPSLERHDTVRRPQKGEASRIRRHSRVRKRGCTKGFLFARPLEESGPGEHLIHFFLRAINLFKHQNHFASQEQERRLSFLLQSTTGGVSVGEGAVTTPSLLLPLPLKTKTSK